jgi:glycosyltransferase involved in cell wall biosynthesis
MTITSTPRLGFIGPMIGRHPGNTTMQGQILSDLFAEAGYSVISTSAKLNRYARLLDITLTMVRMRDDIDILIIEIYGGRSFVVEDVASWLGSKFGQRIVMWLHGGALPEFMARYPRWSHRVLKRADVLVTPSAYLARAVSVHGFTAQVVPNVIDQEAYPFRLRRVARPRLFWMRSFEPMYDPQLAVRVLARLRESIPDARLVMAGRDGGCESETRQLAEKLGVVNAVEFTGFLDMPGKLRVGQDCDVFINTSHVDNTPVAILEACAMGLAVVSSAVGGIPDLLKNGENGLLVNESSAGAFASAIEQLLINPDLVQRLSSRGLHLAHCSSWQQVRPQWEQIFCSLAGEPVEQTPVQSNPDLQSQSEVFT